MLWCLEQGQHRSSLLVLTGCNPGPVTNISDSWATCGVMVSMSAFLACHQCLSAGLSLEFFGFKKLVCGIF